jgi:hypothetical protein
MVNVDGTGSDMSPQFVSLDTVHEATVQRWIVTVLSPPDHAFGPTADVIENVHVVRPFAVAPATRAMR